MRTARVKIRVAITPSGRWSASGWTVDRKSKPVLAPRDELDESVEIMIEQYEESPTLCWVEAEVPIPDDGLVVPGSYVADEPAQ